MTTNRPGRAYLNIPSRRRFARRTLRLALLGLLSTSLVTQPGCMSKWFSGKQDLRTESGKRRDAMKERLVAEDRPTIVVDIAAPAMLTQSQIQNIGLVTQLRGTGGPVESSSQREKMLDTMRRKNSERPNAFLDSDSTALVVVSTAVPPAAPKGKLLDAVVTLSSHAEASDLHNGHLLETPLTEMSLLGGSVREGFDLANMRGPIVTEAQINGSDDPDAKTHGIIIGGGRLLKGRDLGIAIDADFADAITMHAIVPEINRRFTFFNGHEKAGIATPRDDNFLEIKVPPKYENDPYHFINVVLRTSFNETSMQEAERMQQLQKQLLEPTSVREACWHLEAIGEDSIPILAAALDSADPEIRFYVAHSLAYLNDRRAIAPLKALCLQEPAFRAMCLNGLIAIESYEAEDALRELVHAADAEVKYGSVLALRKRNSSDPQVTARKIGKTGNILDIPSNGPPLVAVSLSQSPEVVLFGCNPELHIPAFQYVNKEILISPKADGTLTVSRFRAGEDDRVVNCSADVTSTLLAIAEVDGNYGDWIKFLRECHESGAFVEPFAMNPRPISGRTYDRTKKASELEFGESLYEDTFIHLSDEEEQADTDSNSWNPFPWNQSK